ncbi:5'-methylthioadenosine/S-adenosylhomocysteine nucleosidase [[Clostridium] innocuum]
MGILCAGDTELAAFLPYVKETEVIEKAMLVFHCGNIDRVEVVLLYSGVCKVNAAIAAQLLIDCFAVDCIINAGTAGGIQEQVQLFDTVISERIAYHDVADDILTEFHPWMDSVYFYADENLLQSAKAYSNTTKQVILFETMVSGEQRVTRKTENRF